MAQRYVLAIDQGTTSSRAMLFDRAGAVAGSAQREFRQIFSQPGWVEHDPQEILASVLATIAEVLASVQVDAGELAGIGITNQRETTVVWDRHTGQPVYNAIVWQSRQSLAICERLEVDGYAPLVREKTGLLIDAYFSGSKIRWILDHVDGARARAKRGDLLFGTIDSWLIWNLTGGRLHVTDVSNAARTLLFDIHTRQWDDELLRMLDIPRSLLPQVRSCSEVYGYTVALPGLPAGVPISGVAGDQQAALFGQACLTRGMAKNTYGTGCFLLLNTGTGAVPSSHQLVSTIAWKREDRIDYALEGSVFIAGAVVQWLRDGLKIIRSAAEVETLAASVPDNGGVYLVPAFAGLGAPHWDAYARGAIFGLTRGSTAAHIARAALESIAYQSAEVLRAMQGDAGLALAELRVDGGATANNLLMQFQADLLGVPVVRPKVQETTALGAAYLAGLAVGYWKNTDDIRANWRVDRRFEPQMSRERAVELTAGWDKAVKRSKGWA